MRELVRNPFAEGGRWAANPSWYGYLHYLDFGPLGTADMVDGGGQRLNTLVRARFTAQQHSPTATLLRFTDLVELNPYYKFERFRGLEIDAYIQAAAGDVPYDVPYDDHDVRSRPDPFSVRVTREDGLFPVRKQVVWKIEDEEQWPYLLFQVRYRFDADPLAAFAPNHSGSLYFETLEAPEPDTRVYYRVQDAQERTARELVQAGIALEEERL